MKKKLLTLSKKGDILKLQKAKTPLVSISAKVVRLLIEVLISAVLGLAAGLLFQRITVLQLKKRTDDASKIKLANRPVVIIPWILISAALFALISWRCKETVVMIQYFVFVSVSINIAVVDWLIRKVPNSSLLILLAARAIGMVLEVAFKVGTVKNVVIPSFVGLFIAFLVFSLPSYFGIRIGAGDVKYSGVIGFCLGFIGFFEASAVMGVVNLIYWAYLKITHKGNGKTLAPMGPCLSVGVIITLLIPLTQFIGNVSVF